MSTVSDPEPHTLAGVYALDALDDDLERRRFEDHLSRCADCAEEVRGLTETAARLGRAATVSPPPGLRDRVMAEIGQVRQSPPGVAPDRAARAAGRSRWWPRLATGFAAVGVAAALAMGALTLRAQERVAEIETVNREIAAVLAAPDARTVTGTAEQGVSGTVVVSRAQRRMVFASSGLAALPPERTYQLWQIRPGRIRSAGLVRPDDRGQVPPVVVGMVGGGQVGVTVEPAGGSEQPTTEPLLLLKLPGAS
ncbi:anti-sigma factor [Streptosporangium soli]|nr:anti-sigma factor [Streptosporangium sp. KLBMP 9127]